MKKILAFVLAALMLLSLAACERDTNDEKDATATTSASENEKDSVEINKDAAVSFSSSLDEILDIYGEGSVVKTADSLNKLTGTAVLRFVEFTNDSKTELVTVYTDKDNPDVYYMEITGFDCAEAYLKFHDGSTRLQLTSKSSADAAGPCLWIYTDLTGTSYFLAGEDLSKSADYYKYVQTNDGTPVYSFRYSFTQEDGTLLNGTYEKIELVGMSDDEVAKHFEKNQQVLDTIKNTK